MTAAKMRADEVEIDAALARRLVAAQFPQWAHLPIEQVRPSGTDNALYRLGERMVLRLPRTARTESALRKEREWLPKLAPLLPLAVPLACADGMPAEGYAFTWAIYRWLEGEPATEGRIADLDGAVFDLVSFVAALHAIDPAGGPPPGAHNACRGVPLAARDDAVRASIAALGDTVDVPAVVGVWQSALAAAEWASAPVWIHGDLDARNVLVREGRLSAVLDFGCLGVGDPACDAMVAWKLFPANRRDTFRMELGLDDGTWARARGWVLSQALIALAYYSVETNPTLVREARRWLAEALEDQPSRAAPPHPRPRAGRSSRFAPLGWSGRVRAGGAARHASRSR